MYDNGIYDNGMLSVTRLRERAAHCRQCAVRARSDGIASELEKLAHDYDKDAAWLELLGPSPMGSVLQ